ncbi:HU family DNA-binding protein [Donghicola mangrovi]|uniref:DNA-binding protein n=1 Tax=Donghicola mangrovi TaxID=2729614 RepID=A0A850Q9S3_9RHOB|nr:HU family DNA-binding protein [Donghicola mangrovi]NVO23550.1 hypothetical protein [Donghicola mangrovi]
MNQSSNTAENIDMTVVSTTEPNVAGPVMKKKDLIEAVGQKVDMKKPDVKNAVEAVLEVLGAAIANGQEVNLPPLGRLVAKRTKTGANATVMTLRLRQAKGVAEKAPEKPKGKGKKALAGQGEDS